MLYSTRQTVMKTLSTVAVPLFFIGCNVPTNEKSERAGVDYKSDIALACLSVKASVIALSDTAVDISGNGSLKGRVILLGKSTLDVSGTAEVSDEVCTHSSDNITQHGHASAGTLKLEDFSDHEPAVLDFARKLQSLTPTQTMDQISSSTQLTGNGSLNVIEIRHGIHLSGKSALSFKGGNKDQFVVLIDESGIALAGQASITVSGGTSARNILFLVSGNNSISLAGSGSVVGTYFVPSGSAQVSGNGHLEGAILAHGNISLSGNGMSFTPAAWCPQFESSETHEEHSDDCDKHEDRDDRDDHEDSSSCTNVGSTPTPSGTPTPSPSTTPSTTPSASPSATPAPSVTPAPSTTPTPSPTVPPGPPSLIS